MRLAARALRATPVSVLGIIVAVFIAYPLLELVLRTFNAEGGGALAAYTEAFQNPVALSAIWGSVWLTTVCLIFGVPLAVFLAWIASSTDAVFARGLSILPTLTLALSPLVGAIGWLVLLAPRVGLLNLLVRQLFGMDVDTGPFNAFSLPVIVMLMTFYVVPYVYGPAHAAFSQVDASMLEAARVCGASDRSTLWTVLLPILRPAVLAGSLIGGVMLASMFAIPLILSSGTGLHIVPTEIYFYINQEGRQGPATVMAFLLTAVTIVAMLMYFRILGRGRFVTVSGKGSRRKRVKLGPWRYAATGLVLLFLFLALVLPLCTLVYLSLVGFWNSNVFTQPVSFIQYKNLVDFPNAMQGLANSAWLSITASVIAVVLGLVFSYRRLRLASKVNSTMATIAALPLGISPIVLGLGFLIAFTGPPLPLYGTSIILIIAYAIHVVPIAMRNSDAGLLQLSPELEEAALVCGDSRTGLLWRVLLPILRAPLLSAWGLVFITVYRDLSISILLYTPANVPSSVAMLQIFDQGWLPGVAAYSVLVTLISAAVVAIVIKTAGASALAQAHD